jgi:ABC-type lipoprotein export system ATPase subunit
VSALVAAARRGVAVVVATHDPVLTAAADRVETLG